VKENSKAAEEVIPKEVETEESQEESGGWE